MRYFTFLFAYLWVISFGFGQSISKEDALDDFQFLNEALLHAHGSNYYPNQKKGIPKSLERIENIESDSISILDFRYYLGLALHEIGCLHTSIKKFPLNGQMNEESFFPIPIWIVKNQLVLGRQKTKELKKMEGISVLSINGRSNNYLCKRIQNYQSGDGEGNDFSYEYGNYHIAKLLSFFLNYPQEFRIETSNGILKLDAIDKNKKVYRTSLPIEKEKRILEGEKAYLVIRDSIPVLRIQKFSKKDFSFWQEVMDKINTENHFVFIIDLRGNTGGNRNTGSELMRFFAKEKFSYSILQPLEKPLKYLNRKGKRSYRMSKYIYNVNRFRLKEKTPLGKSFVFTYLPHEIIYKGKLIVLTDGFTASTSTMLTAWMKQQLDITIIGRKAGGGYNGNNGGTFPKITLPISKTEIRFPSYRLILDAESDEWGGLTPDILVEYSVSDWLAEKDKDWEAVKHYLSK